MSGKFSPKSNFKEKLLKSAIIALFIFGLIYILAGLFWDSDFFARDFRNKLAEVRGVKISVLIAGDPDKPVVSSETGCSGTIPYIKLFWNVNPLASSFTIEKNGNTLATGITELEYTDESPETGIVNSYVVTAVGSNGSNVSSDLVEKTAAECAVVEPGGGEEDEDEEDEEKADPTCKIKTIDAKNIQQLVLPIVIQNNLPTFAGNTNIKRAKMRVVISGQAAVVSHFRANQNGFWRWQTPVELPNGTYEIKVTATDPEESARHKTDSLAFQINIPEKTPEKTEVKIEEKIPFDFELEVQNPGKTVYGGEDLNIRLIFSKIENFSPQSEEIVYSITDPNGIKILEISDNALVKDGQEIFKKINLSKLLKVGKYKISARIQWRNSNIFAEDEFFLKEKPLFSLMAKEVYLIDILSGLGWIILLFLILLIIFLLLLFLEHRLTEDAEIQITQNILADKGFFWKRKEGRRL
jgi:hypothetical protein